MAEQAATETPKRFLVLQEDGRTWVVRDMDTMTDDSLWRRKISATRRAYTLNRADHARKMVISAEPDPFYRSDLQGIFRDHRCWKCNDGEKPCVKGNPRDCETLRARND